MKDICSNIVDRTVYPISIKYCGRSYLTLYYYTDRDDSLLHTDKILCFHSHNEMEKFCVEHALSLENDFYEYDFDMPITNPMDYAAVLNNWNLLNTIAGIFGMYFEGDQKKYTQVYDYLFRLNTSIEPIDPRCTVGDEYFNQITRVFRKKKRFLDKLQLYVNV